METPMAIANALQFDLGLTVGIKYAEKIERYAGQNGSEMEHAYREAKQILESRLRSVVYISHVPDPDNWDYTADIAGPLPS